MRHATRVGLRAGLVLVTSVAATACSSTKRGLAKGEQYLADGRAGAATRAYETVLEKKPGLPEALVGVARARIAAGDPGKAIVPAQVAVEVRHPGARPVLAKAFIEAGRGPEATAHLEAELTQTADPSVPLQLLLAEARLASRDLPGAVSAAEEALMAGGGSQAQALGSWLHARTRNCDRAILLGDRALTSSGVGLRDFADAAAAFRMCGDADRAETAGSAARNRAGGGPHDLQVEASRFLRNGDLEGGARRLSWVRSSWPELGVVARDLGVTWMRLKEDGRADLELTQALDLPPFAVARGHNAVQVVHRSADDLDAAQRRAALLELHQALSVVRSRLGNGATAAASLQRVAELQVSNAGLWLDAARAWERAGMPQKGIPALLEALERGTRNASIQAAAAEIFARAGDIDRAIGHGRMAWDLDSSNVDVALHLSALYLERSEDREARLVLEKTRRLRPDERLDKAINALP